MLKYLSKSLNYKFIHILLSEAKAAKKGSKIVKTAKTAHTHVESEYKGE
jgi:hypothetical protein